MNLIANCGVIGWLSWLADWLNGWMVDWLIKVIGLISWFSFLGPWPSMLKDHNLDLPLGRINLTFYYQLRYDDGDFFICGFWTDWQRSDVKSKPVIMHGSNGDEGIQDFTLIGIVVTFRGPPENTFRIIGNAIYDGLDWRNVDLNLRRKAGRQQPCFPRTFSFRIPIHCKTCHYRLSIIEWCKYDWLPNIALQTCILNFPRANSFLKPIQTRPQRRPWKGITRSLMPVKVPYIIVSLQPHYKLLTYTNYILRWD